MSEQVQKCFHDYDRKKWKGMKRVFTKHCEEQTRFSKLKHREIRWGLSATRINQLRVEMGAITLKKIFKN
jgi:hypothetical protein